MKLAIFTAGNDGKKLYEIIKKIRNAKVLYFVDNNPNLLGKKICDNKKIISPYLLKKYIDNKIIDMVLLPSTRMISFGLEEYINQLEGLNIYQYKIVPSYVLRKRNLEESDYKKLEEIIFREGYRQINQLQHLQFHVIDKCNLNCKRCQHFSNLVRDDKLADFNGLYNDLKRLRELFDDINVIAILGGEPLLNPELDKYCEMVRKLYPYSKLEIITNGLLIKSMSNDLIKSIVDNDILINISYYPVLSSVIDDIVEFLQKKEIKYTIGKRITTFSKKMTLVDCENVDVRKRFESCRDRCCTTLRNGRLYPCYLPATIEYFNKEFDEFINTDDSYIDIYDKEITGMEILSRIKKGFSICRYCTEEKEYTWEQSRIVDKSDWLV